MTKVGPVITGMLFVCVQSLGAEFTQAQALRRLNGQVLELERSLNLATPGGENLRSELLTTIERRSEALKALEQNESYAANSLAFPQDVLERLTAMVPEAGAALERHGEWLGTVEYWIEDGGKPGSAVSHVYLKSATERVELHFGGPIPDVRSGDLVRASGLRSGSEIAAESVHVEIAASAGGAQTAPLCSTTGVQNTAVILVNLPAAPLPPAVTPQTVSDIFFGTSTGVSVDGFLREASYGLASVQGGVFGPFTLTGIYSNSSCSALSSVYNDAIAAAINGGVNLNNYSRIVLVFPDGLGCLWAGFASVGGCSSSTASGTFNATTSYLSAGYMGTRTAGVSLAAHELGHNLGLLHSGIIDAGTTALGPLASPGTEYDQNGDYWSVMGETVLGIYPAPQKAEVLGWMNSPANYLTVQSGGSFTVQPLETTPAGLQALKIQRGTGNNAWLWLEYRSAIDAYDSTLLPQPFGGALIHYEDGNTAQGHTYLPNFTPSDTTWNSPALSVGQTWSDPYSNVSISVTSATAAGLNVLVNYGSVPCTHANPSLTISPANPSVTAGSSVTYSLVIANNDSTACAASTFSLSPAQPASWNGSFSSGVVVLSPGQSASVALTEIVPAGTSPGTFPISVTVSSPNSNSVASTNCTVQAALLTDTLTVSGTTFSVRQSVPIGALVDFSNSPVSGAKITFRLTKPNGSTVTNSGVTNVAGQASWNWKPAQKDPAGTYSVTSSATYNGQNTASNTISFLLQ